MDKHCLELAFCLFPGIKSKLTKAKHGLFAMRIQHWARNQMKKKEVIEDKTCGVCYTEEGTKSGCCNNYLCGDCFTRLYESAACQNVCPFCKSCNLVKNRITNPDKIIFTLFATHYSSYNITNANTIGNTDIIRWMHETNFDPARMYVMNMVDPLLYGINLGNLMEKFDVLLPDFMSVRQMFRVVGTKRVEISNHVKGHHLNFQENQIKLVGGTFTKKREWGHTPFYKFTMGMKREEWLRSFKKFIIMQSMIVYNLLRNNEFWWCFLYEHTTNSLRNIEELYYPLVIECSCPIYLRRRSKSVIMLKIPNPKYYADINDLNVDDDGVVLSDINFDNAW